MSKSVDLNTLASNAQKEIERNKHRTAALLSRPPRNYAWVRWGVGLVVAGLVFMTLGDSSTKRFWLGVSEQKQIAEMTAALTAARVAVDSAHTTTGEWPRQVPLPALAALVELQSPGPEYRLLARTGQTQLTMTPTGELLSSKL